MATEANPSQIFVGNIPEGQSPDFIRTFFSSVGPVTNVEMPEGRTHCWVTFSTPEDADKAVASKHGSEISGNAIRVELRRPPRTRRAMDPNVEKKQIPNAIFVGNLPRNLEAGDAKQRLADAFADCGEIVGTRFDRRRGHGHVTFQDEAAVARALAKPPMDFDGRTARVQVRERVVRKRNQNATATKKASPTPNPFRVFVGNIGRTNREVIDALKQIASPFGDVERVLPRRGFVYLDYTSERAAESAVPAMNGIELFGRKLRVEPHQPSTGEADNTKSEETRAPNPRRVWVGGLIAPDEAKLRDVLGQVGQLEDLIVRRGFGFATYTTEEAAEKAVATLSGAQVPGVPYTRRRRNEDGELVEEDMPAVECVLRVAPERSSNEPDPSRVYVGNLPEGFTEEQLENMFSSFGVILRAIITRSGNSGYVQFDSADGADAAIKGMNGGTIPGYDEALTVEQARPRVPNRRRRALARRRRRGPAAGAQSRRRRQ